MAFGGHLFRLVCSVEACLVDLKTKFVYLKPFWTDLEKSGGGGGVA